MIDTKHASITVTLANLSGTRWEVDIRELYVTADSPAEAIAILTSALAEENER